MAGDNGASKNSFSNEKKRTKIREQTSEFDVALDDESSTHPGEHGNLHNSVEPMPATTQRPDGNANSRVPLHNTESLETDDHQFLFHAKSEPDLAASDIAKIESNRAILMAMRKLLRAFRFSSDCNRSRWDFAIEIQELRELGISTEELRWLIGKGLIDHAEESLENAHLNRTFQSSGGFSLSPRSCFVLTDSGLGAAKVLVSALSKQADSNQLSSEDKSANNPDSIESAAVPKWDSMRHELWFSGKLIKKYKWRAANQEAILSAFEEEGWPPRIDDPLPPIAEMDPKRRLGDAIKCLNRSRANLLVKFCGDGSGEGVLWEVCENTSNGSVA